jgi:Domain of unknown function (DUF4136)
MQSLLRLSAVLVAFLAVAVLGGCGTYGTGTTVTYSYEPAFGFAASKTYRWGKARAVYRQDALVEANVRFVADREWQARGLTRAEKADLLVWIGYEFDTESYGYGTDLRALTLNVSRADSDELVWRGLATGRIKTDAASGELKAAVETMLANFPPK